MRVSFSQAAEGRQERSLETWADVAAGDGETVDEQSDSLEKPLRKNQAFFLQAIFGDYASGKLSDD